MSSSITSLSIALATTLISRSTVTDNLEAKLIKKDEIESNRWTPMSMRA